MNPPRSMADVPQGSAVVLVTTPHCPHCRSIRGHIEAVVGAGSAATEPSGVGQVNGVTFIEVSAPDSPDLATELKIKAAPTLLAFRDGAEVTRHVGSGGEADVRRVFEAAAGSSETGSPKAIRRFSISSESRWIRTGLGLVLIAAGAITNVIWLALLGAVFLASGWYDRVIR